MNGPFVILCLILAAWLGHPHGGTSNHVKGVNYTPIERVEA